MYQAIEILGKLGQQLDVDIFPRVCNHGIVTPGDVDGSDFFRSQENKHERQRTRRSETRSWTRPSRGQRQAGRSGTPCPTTSTVCADLRVQYQNELKEVLQAYPETKIWQQDDGLWLQTESLLLPGLSQKAVFLTGIPFSRERLPRGWGFWLRTPLNHPLWIGPRHTNMPDGSICAFDPEDGTWEVGGSLITLLDLYTLWALRHLHLHVVGYWPGRQVATYVIERVLEIKPNELCGCGGDKSYIDCCRPADLNSNLPSAAIKFHDLGGFRRCPPMEISRFIQNKGPLPLITQVLPWSR